LQLNLASVLVVGNPMYIPDWNKSDVDVIRNR
jgi:hypothetical protein